MTSPPDVISCDSGASRRLCLFSSYFIDTMPLYVRAYLTELRRHCSEVIFINNEDSGLDSEDCSWLASQKIQLLRVRNEGYDFGMWSKALQSRSLADFEELLLVNDSCVLVAPLDDLLDWCRRSTFDYCGLVDSHEISYHVQSYFLLVKVAAIPPVVAYFEQHGVVGGDVDRVIELYEVGLSQYLLGRGVKIGAYYSVADSRFRSNASFYFAEELVRAGMPMIKRKLLTLEYARGVMKRMVARGCNPDPSNFRRLIAACNPRHFADFPALLASAAPRSRCLLRLRITWWRFKYGGLYARLGIRRQATEMAGFDDAASRRFPLRFGDAGGMIDVRSK